MRLIQNKLPALQRAFQSRHLKIARITNQKTARTKRRMVRPFFQTMTASIIHLFRWIVARIQSWIRRSTGPIVATDSGRKVRLGRQIAEGGFSIVFEATDVVQPTTLYAMKRINCPDPEILRACRNEAGVHRAVRHPSLMPLLGMAITENESICYMLFPYIPHSLRSEVNRRTFDRLDHDTEPPWTSERTVLQIFHRLLQGVQALHERARVSHRDIKLENILLLDHFQPVLMDFGSAGPTAHRMDTRRDVLGAVEQASIHTTLPYRPPELFEGGIRVGDEELDYRKVDVWSLACTLFALLYGASPFESEFSRSTGNITVVECTQLSVLKPVPWPYEQSAAFLWYSADMHELLVYMLEQDRLKRPGLSQVLAKVQGLIEKEGGRIVEGASAARGSFDDDEDNDGDGIALMSSNRMRV
jgi:serine/threonine kinase 16